MSYWAVDLGPKVFATTSKYEIIDHKGNIEQMTDYEINFSRRFIGKIMEANELNYNWKTKSQI